jgi:tRNA threonylcarbamoyladenosine biosynthesis protein TsaB
MILIINTANEGYAEVMLVEEHDILAIRKAEGKYNQSEQLLPAIEESLKEAGKSLGDLGAISVVSGPGGFTALRIGIVTANVLSYALDIPVVGVNHNDFKDNNQLIDLTLENLKNAKSGSIVMPEYGREPNIT